MIKADSPVNAEGIGLAHQLIFQVTGWLAAFWEPALDESISELSLAQRSLPAPARITMHSSVITSTTAKIQEAKGPLCRLLSRFGTLLPEPRFISREAFRGGPEAGPEIIDAAYVSFDSLRQDLKLNFEWTSTLNQHLELDQPNKTLYIFRYPSICRLMCSKKGDTLFSQIFREWIAGEENWTTQDEQDSSPAIRRVRRGMKIEHYSIEVLLSFYLIFGRSSASWAGARRLLQSKEAEWKDQGQYDPLLETLCTKGRDCSDVMDLLEEIQAGKERAYFSVDEYPFLGERLATLHTLSLLQNPRSIKRLWNDRRNLTAWFALWAVVVFGGGTLLLQFIQVFLQAFPA